MPHDPSLLNQTVPYGIYPNCTLKVDCNLDYYSNIDYYPSLGGNTFYLALFAILLITQVVQGVLWKTWSYTIAMLFGLVLECVGYGGRVAMSQNPFEFNYFLVYLICLTIAPVFLTASIYLSLSRLIIHHDPLNIHSRLAPNVYTYLFVSADFISLVLQAAGGGLSATANSEDAGWSGVQVMIAGLAFQVVSLFAFGVLCAEFAFKVWKAGRGRDIGVVGGKLSSTRVRGIGMWELALTVATVAILVRSLFRCVELKDGFGGKLANEEVPFMILEGGMISIAAIALTIWHPGWVLGKGKWRIVKGAQRGEEDGETTELRGRMRLFATSK